MRVWVDGLSLTGRVTGVQRVVERLLQAMVEIDPGLDMRAFRFLGDGPARPQVRAQWRTALAHRRAHAILANRLFAPPLEILLRTRPGVFLFPDFTTLPVSPLSKSVVIIYDLSFFTVPQFSNPGLGSYLRRLVPRSITRADQIITISRFAADEIIERFPSARGRVTVVSPAADARFRPASDAEIAHFRQKLGVDRPYLLFAGTLEPRKNIVGVLEAYEALPASVRARVPLVIAGGKGWRDDAIRARLAAAGPLVKALGYIDDADLPSLYSGARGLVFPSFYEGFGLPPLEAMACGTPVITSRTTALPEVVGDAALLVDPTSVEEIGAAMGRLIDDDGLHTELRRRGLARARLFSWEGAARTLLGVLRALH